MEKIFSLGLLLTSVFTELLEADFTILLIKSSDFRTQITNSTSLLTNLFKQRNFPFRQFREVSENKFQNLASEIS